MALKRKISKEEYEKLSDAFKSEYVEKDGEFVLDIEGDIDTGALSRAKSRETQLRREAEENARKLQEKLDEYETNDARKKGDVETLEKAWKNEKETLTADYTKKLTDKDAFIKTTLLNAEALAIANRISTSPSVMLPHIKSRLTVDFDGEQPSVKVLDAKGNVSLASIEDLSKEFVANEDFSAILVGNKASGGRAPENNQSRRVSAMGDDGKPVMLSTMNPKDLASHIKSSKQES